jgi:hypothetical protein
MEEKETPRPPKVNKVAAAIASVFALSVIPATAIGVFIVQWMVGGCCGHTPTPGEDQRVELASFGVIVVGIAAFAGSLYLGWKRR